MRAVSLSLHQLKARLQILGEGVRAGLYPMSDTEVYWYVAINTSLDQPSIPNSARQAAAKSYVKGWAHGIEACIDHTDAESVSYNRFWTRTSASKRSSLPLCQGNVTLAGDAFHPMTPNLGQVCILLGQF